MSLDRMKYHHTETYQNKHAVYVAVYFETEDGELLHFHSSAFKIELWKGKGCRSCTYFEYEGTLKKDSGTTREKGEAL